MESLLSILLFVGVFYFMMRFGCGAHMRGGGCGHSSHRHDKTAETPAGPTVPDTKTMTRDPVSVWRSKPLGRNIPRNTALVRFIFVRKTAIANSRRDRSTLQR